MKIALHAAALALAATAATAATAHAGVNIIDNDEQLTVDCAKDKTVNIAGNHATVTLTGTCDVVNIAGNEATVKGSAVRVNVSGNENTLVLEAVDAINVSGNENTISYKKGVKKKTPSVSNPGTDNKISRAK